MYFILSILFIIVGLFMLIKPKLVIEISNSFKFYDPGTPTDLYVFSTRFGGVMILLVGLSYILLSFFKKSTCKVD